ncbi:MAG: S1 RNA-binding domain-containing protein, partial [Chloroflexia bacterium]|nr:S1 RNA-binding domain-containing protein [Chloroflexia bacterium]
VAATYEVGELVRGSVTQLANFGAFARIEDGIEGLIHVSELADERIQHPKQVVHESQELILRIIRIDPQRRRMGLSLRRALDTPDAELTAKFGESILEERDALARQIRQALEAEGLTGTAPTDEERRSEDGLTVTTEDGPALQTFAPDAPDSAAEASSAETQTPGEEGPAVNVAQEAATAAARPQPRQRAPRAPRPAPEVPAEFEGEEMSAMEMAFAMAGASTEISEEKAETGGEEDGQQGESASTEDGDK